MPPYHAASDNVQLSELKAPLRSAPSRDPLVSQYILDARAENTRRAYAADLRDFAAWGGRLPSTVDEIARYLAHSAGRLQPITLRRRLAALASAHRDEGLAKTRATLTPPEKTSIALTIL